MLRDVFYYGTKPNVHPREQFAESLEDARSKCTTDHFWIINEFCDYRRFDWDFDFEFLPDEDVWAEDHNNVWPSQHQKDSGTWLCPKERSDIIVYRCDVDPVIRRSGKTANWVELDLVDHRKFDFSWHPDPADPPFIYKWGCKYFPAQIKHVLEYHVEGATTTKYMNSIVELLPNDYWVEHQPVDKAHFDYSWRPDPMDPPFIYVWGNKWVDAIFKPTLEYIVPDATTIKYMPEHVPVLPEWDRWVEVQQIDRSKFDLSWRPDPREPAYIYTWGNEYIEAELRPTLEYHCDGATERKYMTNDVPVLPEWDRWEIPAGVSKAGFNFSWRPDPREPDFIYEFATQWQKTGGPKYVMPGATEKTYVNFQKATRLTNMENWTIPDSVDVSGFDFSWHPDATSPDYAYVFATQWAFSGGPIYTVNGSTETKYVDDQTAIAKPNKDNWVYDETEIDIWTFDFSWHPYVEDQPYIYQFGTQHQKTGGPRYITPGADSSSPVKYIDTRIIKANRLPNKVNPCWNTMYDVVDFDWSWHPDDTDTPYIYVFGNQWHAAEVMPTVEYVMSGAKEIKYVHSQVATLAPVMDNWTIPDNLDTSTFDFSWRPEPGSPLYIYEFATQWQKTGGPQYVMHGATEKSYVNYQKATRLPLKENWNVPGNLDITTFDFSWHPDATSPPYVYVFATQWSFSGGPIYTVPGATETKYIDDQTAISLPDRTNWIYDETEIDAEAFDFSWHPYVEDQPYIYQFGTQWQKTGGPRYITLGADSSSPVKYIDTRILKAKRLPNKSKFKSLVSRYGSSVKIEDFDYSWHPDDTNPPYVYFFGNQWYSAEDMPTLSYEVTPDSTQEVFVNEPKTVLASNRQNWKIPENVNVNTFDFSWVPHPGATPYTYQFGTASDKEDGPMYITPGSADEIVYLPRIEVAEIQAKTETVEPVVIENYPDEETNTEFLDMFFVDKGNPESAARFEALKAKFGTRIQKTRYLNSWVDTINRCTNRATSQLLWVLNSELDYSNFDFSYYPNVWQMKMVHVFGTQWSHWGTTFMVNRETFSYDTKYINIIEHLSNLNFIKTIRATATACVHDIIMIDHGNKEITSVIENVEQKSGRKIFATIKYDESYLNTIKNYVTKLPNRKEHYLWICSSVCDYSVFDFTYVCDPFSKDNLHVFPSGIQKFGDTFFIDVNKTKEIIDEMEKLEEYHKVNFNNSVTTTRLPEPIIVTRDDTHVNAISNVSGFPYATIITSDNAGIDATAVEPMNLWSPATKNILITSTGATRIVVPVEAKEHVTKELYDYPYIKKMPKLVKSSPIDIVFLSNGETGADENWEHLLNVSKGLSNRVVRVDGVNGRAAAYHAAAEASETPWMFTVFAKLKVSPKFDWNWQPDRMQVPKHYIFHARNPVNGLTYGHQAMIAYNKKLTLANEGRGLDFTLDDEHEIVPLISGTAMYNTDPFSTWRTAFREVLKLKADDSDESRVRLDAWLNKADGDFGQFSIKGALDAEEYYDEVAGDFDALKLSYEWAWLRDRFEEM